MSTAVLYRSDRLQLRPYRPTDAARVLDIHSRMDVVRWLGNPPYHLMSTETEALEWIGNWRTTHEQDPRCGGWAIVRPDEVVAGTVLLAPLPNGAGKIQIGWHLHPDSTGCGYVTEAARALLGYGFDRGLDEIWCDMFPDNLPSAAVAVRLGMEDLGVIDDPWYGDQSRVFRITAAQSARSQNRPAPGPEPG